MFLIVNRNYVMSRDVQQDVDLTTNDAMLQTQKLLEQCGGFILSDICCACCVAGQQWYDGMKHRLAKIGLRPIEFRKREAYCFGQGRPVFTTLAELVPVATGGKCYTVRFSIVPVLIPAPFSRTALAELHAVHDLRRNLMELRELNIQRLKTSLTDSGHPRVPCTQFPRRLPAGPRRVQHSQGSASSRRVVAPFGTRTGACGTARVRAGAGSHVAAARLDPKL